MCFWCPGTRRRSPGRSMSCAAAWTMDIRPFEVHREGVSHMTPLDPLFDTILYILYMYISIVYMISSYIPIVYIYYVYITTHSLYLYLNNVSYEGSTYCEPGVLAAVKKTSQPLVAEETAEDRPFRGPFRSLFQRFSGVFRSFRVVFARICP